jgi:hypothetical protein
MVSAIIDDDGDDVVAVVESDVDVDDDPGGF